MNHRADTCCINKESSAELTESINSMYRWYGTTEICYVLLSDVCKSSADVALGLQVKQSRWFDRGWCLQELLAPASISFFDKTWNLLGTKESMLDLLSIRTGVPHKLLAGDRSLSRYSIAQRMSWASTRQTTRVEDIAYCLMGIFDVNMPLLYGEGEKAFFRLQQQIIEQYDDHSIFAWPLAGTKQAGMLAQSPAAFAGCGHVRSLPSYSGRPSFRMTNRGLSLKLPLRYYAPNVYIAYLHCTIPDTPNFGNTNYFGSDNALGLLLHKLTEDDQYARIGHNSITGYPMTLLPTDIQVKVNVRQRLDPRQNTSLDAYVVGPALERLGAISLGSFFDEIELKKYQYDEPGDELLLHNCDKTMLLRFGFDFESNPICLIVPNSDTDAGANGFLKRHPIHQGHFSKLGIFYDPLSPGERYGPDYWPIQAVRAREIYDNEASADFAFDIKGSPGYWAIKGDRQHGLDIKLWARPPLDHESVWGSCRGRVLVGKTEVDGQLGWRATLHTSPSDEFMVR